MVTCVFLHNETNVEWSVLAAIHCEILIETQYIWRQRSKWIKSHNKVCLAEFAREDVMPESASFYATLNLTPQIAKIDKQEEAEFILQIKLKFTSGTMKTRLNYAITGVPYGSCKPAIKWQTKREAVRNASNLIECSKMDLSWISL